LGRFVHRPAAAAPRQPGSPGVAESQVFAVPFQRAAGVAKVRQVNLEAVRLLVVAVRGRFAARLRTPTPISWGAVPLAGQLPGGGLEVAIVVEQGEGGEPPVAGAGARAVGPLERVGVGGEYGQQVGAVLALAVAGRGGVTAGVLPRALPVDHFAAG